eukprot:comp22682_c0_seq1/m.35083 comp22682_c0_seq1/g.35083  ORF comp22682_c0_seq1/g.35083 comp22682_c0_seq1/m.35083 type:complete len:949 (-) comp22682_c0_seq1:113-2959(-)
MAAPSTPQIWKAFHAYTVLKKPAEPNNEVVCCAWRGSNLYVGTSNGIVLHYVCTRMEAAPGTVSVEARLERQRQLSSYRIGRIDRIVVSETLNKLVVQGDTNIVFLRLPTLQLDFAAIEGYPTSMKGVTAFTYADLSIAGYEFGPSEVCFELTIAKRRSLYNFQVSRNQPSFEREVTLSSSIRCLAQQGSSVCVALKKEYRVVDLATGRQTEICPFDEKTTNPFVLALRRQDGGDMETGPEFLVGITTADTVTLGVFVNPEGGITRPNLTFRSCPEYLAFDFPYVIALFAQHLEVHSVVDSEIKQRLKWKGYNQPGDADRGVLLATTTQISCLEQLSVVAQVHSLLQGGKVEEAIRLADAMLEDKKDTDPEAVALHRSFMQQAAYVNLGQADFEQAMVYFARANTDPLEVLEFFNMGRPEATDQHTPTESLQLSNPTSRKKSLVEELTRGKPQLLKDGYRHLCNYLESRRSTGDTGSRGEVIDTALARMYAYLGDSALLTLVSGPNNCKLESVEEELLDNERYQALALLYSQKGKPVKAIGVWRRLEEGEGRDPQDPGLACLSDYVSTLDSLAIVFKAVAWLAPRAPILAADILRKAVEAQPDSFPPARVLEFLEPMGSLHLLLFLEALVFYPPPWADDIMQPFHTRLAFLYVSMARDLIGGSPSQENIEAVELLSKLENEKKGKNKRPLPDVEIEEPDEVQDENEEGRTGSTSDSEKAKARTLAQTLRRRLLVLLQWSSLYDAEEVLAAVDGSKLQRELVTIYGKLGRHEAALRLLAHTMEDWPAAERYCQRVGGSDRLLTETIYLALLSVCLSPPPHVQTMFQQRAMDLLNRRGREMDPARVLELLPQDWPISSIEQFLRTSIRHTQSTHRQLQVTRNLASTQHTQTQALLMQQQKGKTVVGRDTKCIICNLPLSLMGSLECKLYQNGSVSHADCGPPGSLAARPD